MSIPGKPSILLVDDEENLRRTLAIILNRAGYEVETAATVKEAHQCLEHASFNLTFLDLKLPDANGLTLLPELRSRFPKMPVLILTAHDKLDSAFEAVRHGARDYLLKPLDPPVILRRVKEILAEQ
jgi:DNA-binding NtrC family response regulator